MKAFVISEDQIKSAGLVVVGVIVLVFLLGYYVGSSQITAIDENKLPDNEQLNNVTNKAAIAAAVATANSSKVAKKDSKPKKADKSANKKNNDKKSAKADTKSNKKKEVKKSKNTATKNKPKNDISKDKKQDKKTEIKKDKTVEKTNSAKKTEVKKNTTNEKTAVKKDKNINTRTATDVDKKRIYSIQAGMFSSETNANSFIEKLSAKQFDAYISDFVSSSGAIKYNVRVGKFAQRAQARELLKEFQKSFSSPAYVVIYQP